MYKLPLKITEQPHRGKAKTWFLYDEKHLNECIQSAGSSFDEWAYAGQVPDDEKYSAEVFIDYLRHDLSALEVEEIEL